jgi:hypothetical protein
MRRSGAQGDESLRCSFCHKAQHATSKLISSPSDYPKAYICDECILVCAAILEDDRPQPETIGSDPQAERNPLLDHPLASEFLTAVERWTVLESIGDDGANEFAAMRSLAMRMIAGQAARASKR